MLGYVNKPPYELSANGSSERCFLSEDMIQLQETTWARGWQSSLRNTNLECTTIKGTFRVEDHFVEASVP